MKRRDHILTVLRSKWEREAKENEHAPKGHLEKLEAKGLDWIAINDVSDKEIGFGSDINDVTLLSRRGESIPLGRKSKQEIAKGILDHIWS